MVGRCDGVESVSRVDEAEEEERRRQRGVGCRSRWMQQCDRGLKMGHLWCLPGSKRRRKENGSSGMWGLPLVSGDKAPTLGYLVIEKAATIQQQEEDERE